jgi:hypothetical protein
VNISSLIECDRACFTISRDFDSEDIFEFPDVRDVDDFGDIRLEFDYIGKFGALRRSISST